MVEVSNFIRTMPKAELHVHLEGTLEGDLLLVMAERNKIDLPFDDADGIRRMQNETKTGLTNNLVNFLRCLDICREAMRTAQDYYDTAMAFVRKSAGENVVYLEVTFDVQQAIRQGVALSECIEALSRARREAKRDHGIDVQLIACFQRDHPVENAMETLMALDPHREEIVGIGLDNYETPGFPELFAPVMSAARDRGYRLTSHCDVNQPDSLTHIRECVDLLGVERIDHGLNTAQDAALVEKIVSQRIALTGCPTFHVSMTSAPSDRVEMIKTLFHAGALISLNTDDPAQFGSGYLSHTLAACQAAAGFGDDEMIRFMRNAFESAWIDDRTRSEYLTGLDRFRAASAA
ncbi:adenosine deaminase [Hoeflea poritis]|uniref:Adenosine deaminase n=1 Tax=Hoeflea poritis TaxID=2993659 RepID=A0ABT4VR52_9HYPH|nr:adenosine deaminase [Hoeflea poritis]MDA4847169.1 adenosine deaminase [Hoeflea poritis]